MGRTCLVAVALTASVLAAANAPAEDRALLVGIGQYEQQSPFRDLRGIDRDLAIMRGVARELGFDENQIRVVADEEATFEGIRSAFESWLIDAVGPGERALFYFSGHGHYVADANGDEPDRRDEVLVPHDYAGTVQALTNVVVDDDMAAWISRLRTDDVLIFLDACHSGTAVRSAAGAAAWSMFDGGDAPTGVSTKSAGGSDAGYLALSAARDSEMAQATSRGSTFTIGVGRAVRDAAASESPLTMNGINKMAAEEIARAHPEKIFHPVLSGDLARADHDLRRRRGQGPPRRSLWDRVVSATRAPSQRIDVSGVQPAYRVGDTMSLDVVMPVDGYLSVVSVTEGADEGVLWFPNRWVRGTTHFQQGERVRVPDGGLEVVMELEDVNHRGDERNMIVVVVSPGPLGRERLGIEAMVPYLDSVYRAGVPYVVRP